MLRCGMVEQVVRGALMSDAKGSFGNSSPAARSNVLDWSTMYDSLVCSVNHDVHDGKDIQTKAWCRHRL